MQVNPSAPLQPTQQQPEPQGFERDTAQPKIERKPGEPFDVRKADIAIQARWVRSDIARSQ